MKIAFDVDDTLIIPSIALGFEQDIPNYNTIDLYHWFQEQGHYMIIWSGGGVDYAKHWANKLGLEANEYPMKEFREDIDIAFDDCEVNLATINIKVKRFNNYISRREWNKNKQKFINN